MSRVSPSLLTGCFHTSAIWLNRSTPNQPPALTVEPEGPCYCQKLQKRHPVVVLEELVVGSRQLRLPCLLGKGLQDGIHLLGHGCQCELKLLLRKRRGRRSVSDRSSLPTPGEPGRNCLGNSGQKEGSWVADLDCDPWMWGLQRLAPIAGRHFHSRSGDRSHLSLQCVTTSRCLRRWGGGGYRCQLAMAVTASTTTVMLKRDATTASEIDRSSLSGPSCHPWTS